MKTEAINILEKLNEIEIIKGEKETAKATPFRPKNKPFVKVEDLYDKEFIPEKKKNHLRAYKYHK